MAEPALVTLAQAFNDEDPVYRRLLLDECWAKEGKLTIDGAVVAEGIDALARHIETSQREDPQFSARAARVQTSGDREWGRFDIRRRHGPRESFSVDALRGAQRRLVTAALTRTPVEDIADTFRARLQRTVVENPIPALGVLGGMLYLALRIPVGLFYNDLGVTADEAGFGPQVLVPQSLSLFGAFLVAMLAFGAMNVWMHDAMLALRAAWRLGRKRSHGRALLTASVILVAPVVVLVLLLQKMDEQRPAAFLGLTMGLTYGTLGAFGLVIARAPWIRAEMAHVRARARRIDLRGRLGQGLAVLTALYGALGLLVFLPILALAGASSVREGGVAGGRLLPWRAQPVEIRWVRGTPARLTNDCRVLRLLGTSDGQLIVFDTRLDTAFRISVTNAVASVRRDC